MALVYLATSPSGKRYVGWTAKTLAERIAAHTKNARQRPYGKFAWAVRKYGDALCWRVLVSNVDSDTAKALEIGFIRLFDSKKRGYNCTDGGEGCAGLAVSESTRSLLSTVNKKAWAVPGAKAKRAETLRQVWGADPNKKKQASENMKAVRQDPTYYAAASETTRRIWADADRRFRRDLACRALTDAQIQNTKILLSLGSTCSDISRWFAVAHHTARSVRDNKPVYQVRREWV